MTTTHPLIEKLSTLRKELNATYMEREDMILCALLSVLSKSHLYVLGVPGTAKSDAIRAIVHTIKNARYFETALSKTRPPEKVLGPLNIKRFRENGEYILNREGYATDVEFAFFDEVGKMSPVLGHDLLALLNERVIHEVRDGVSVHDAPLYTAFTASNEMITDESDDAAALWDRLLVRCVVRPIQDTENFQRLLISSMTQPTVEIDWSELKHVIDEVIPNIGITTHALDALTTLWQAFQRESLAPSNRRWRASMRVLQAHAFLDGRDAVDEDDIAILRFTLWDTLETIDRVERLCMAAANPFVEPLLEIREIVKEIDTAITDRQGLGPDGNPQDEARQAYGKEAIKKLTAARGRLDTLLMEANGRRIPGFKRTSDEHRRILKRAFTVCLEQSDEVADAMMAEPSANRLGMGDGGNE